MEAILLIGIQGSGKSTFYRERLFDTHLRISLDLLRTRYRERRLLQLCLETGQRFVVDKTNVRAAERARYIGPARAARFRVVGYFFEPDPKACFERNQRRAHPVPAPGLFGTLKRLDRPTVRGDIHEWQCCGGTSCPGRICDACSVSGRKYQRSFRRTMA